MVEYFVVALFSVAVAGVFVFLYARWLMRRTFGRCTAYRPAKPIPGTRIDTNMYRCNNTAFEYVPAWGPFRGGWFCHTHANEEKKIRRNQ